MMSVFEETLHRQVPNYNDKRKTKERVNVKPYATWLAQEYPRANLGGPRRPHAPGDPTTSLSSMMDVYSLVTVLLEIAQWRVLR